MIGPSVVDWAACQTYVSVLEVRGNIILWETTDDV